jgi:hypothetical protein
MIKKTFILFSIITIAFFVWRFIRPLSIFDVDEKFARPMVIKVPEGLSSVSAKECKLCHEEIYKEWSESMHAKAWTDPYYQIDYVFDGSQQVCLNCHIPLADQQENLVLGFKDKQKFKPILKPNPNFNPALQLEGVTCIVCHYKDGKIVGPFGSTNAPHATIADPEITHGTKLCEKCHVVSGERWDTFYKLPPCGTVAEITKSGKEPDCVGCHMPKIQRPIADGMEKRKSGKHFFRGGHFPETVKKSLKVEYEKEETKDNYKFNFMLTNIGASHYLPTGTPDRHLTLELRLYNDRGDLLKEKIFPMKRHIIWRPFIIDLVDKRLPFEQPRTFVFSFKKEAKNPPSELDVKVRYHLLDEKRRARIGYENKEPIAYPIYEDRILLD